MYPNAKQGWYGENFSINYVMKISFHIKWNYSQYPKSTSESHVQLTLYHISYLSDYLFDIKVEGSSKKNFFSIKFRNFTYFFPI